MHSTPKPETQATERSTIQPHGLSRICKPAVAGIGIIALAAITVACSPEPDKRAEIPPPPCPQCKSKPLSENAERELTANEDQIGGVFVVKKNGKISVFRRSADRGISLELPFDTAIVKDLGGISFVITNPRFCWETSDGDKECITYP